MGRPKGWRISKSGLAHLLEQRQMTRTELAAAAGISPQLLSDLTGNRGAGASMKTVRQLVEALDCRPGLLFPEADGFAPPERIAA